LPASATPRRSCGSAATTGHGHLQLAGRTTELTATASAAVATVLTPQIGPDHPWPEVLPSTRWGRPGPPTVYTQVRGAVVEVSVDTAVEQHRRRHAARFVRLRSDLRVDDLVPRPSPDPPTGDNEADRRSPG
jgi:hypothetical protein